MASVFLRFDGERQVRRLPAVCVRCGAAATTTVGMTFTDEDTGRPARVHAPLCGRHPVATHAFALAAGTAALMLLALAALAVLRWQAPGAVSPTVGTALTASAVVTWTGFFLYLLFADVRARDVTAKGVALAGVSRAFAESYRRGDVGDTGEPSRTHRPLLERAKRPAFYLFLGTVSLLACGFTAAGILAPLPGDRLAASETPVTPKQSAATPRPGTTPASTPATPPTQAPKIPAPKKKKEEPPEPPRFTDWDKVEPGEWVYLSDLPEFDVKAGPWPFAKNGRLGDGDKTIKVGKVPSARGLGMHPPDRGYAAAKYRLDGKATLFKAGVALDDSVLLAHGPVAFEVLGDGVALWKSHSFKKKGYPYECAVNVTGVNILELRAHATSFHIGAHAVWLDPRIRIGGSEADASAPWLAAGPNQPARAAACVLAAQDVGTSLAWLGAAGVGSGDNRVEDKKPPFRGNGR